MTFLKSLYEDVYRAFETNSSAFLVFSNKLLVSLGSINLLPMPTAQTPI